MTIRNNEDRMGARQRNVSDPAPPQVQVENQKVENVEEVPTPPISFSTPTEFVDLPSKGIYYLEGHPLCGKDTVEIRYMTARDEDILTSRSLLKKGVAIDRLLQNILIDKTIKVDELLVGDKNALIIAARITGYGANYQTKMMCPACGSHGRNTFDLENIGMADTEIPPEVDKTSNGTFVVTTPRTKTQVELKLLTGADEKKLAKAIAMKKKKKLPESALTDQLRLTIASVGGAKEPNMINLFIGSLPASDARYIRDIYAKLMPNVDMKQDFECVECGYEQEMEVPFTTDFFWPK